MLNFNYHVPTKIVFGKGTIEKLGELTKDYKRIMLIYGKGSIKRNGVYDKVMLQIKDRIVCEFGGIEANPDYETCMKAALLAREKCPDFMLAVGGGSVLDGTKFITAAAAWKYTEDPFDIFIKRELEPKSFCPFGSIMTFQPQGVK